MEELPVALESGLIFFTDEITAGAGHHLHLDSHPVHTHSFIEVFTVIAGTGIHRSPLGDQQLCVGDVVLLRPGAWHALDDCDHLEVLNCGFAPEMLRQELAWMREDPLLSYLLFEGPYTPGHQGTLAFRLDEDQLAEYISHLEALRPPRANIIGRLTLALGVLSRATGSTGATRTHPAVLAAVRLLESDLTRRWTLTDLADATHLAPNYLIRLFKTNTGLPPLAYLAHHRAETAAVLLSSTDQPIARIGATVGWPDQSHFTRRFKAHYGVNPSTYRLRRGA